MADCSSGLTEMDRSRELKRIVRIQKYSHLRLIKSYLNQGSEARSSSENDEKCTKGGKGECLKGCRYKGKSSEGEEDSDSSEESQVHPSPLRKLAWAWERRALRAEASLKRYQDGRSHGENGRSKA
jgi:hypothetical protein